MNFKFCAILNVSKSPYTLLKKLPFAERRRRSLSARPSHYSRLRSQSVLIVGGRDEWALCVFLRSFLCAKKRNRERYTITCRNISFIYLFVHEEIYVQTNSTSKDCNRPDRIPQVSMWTFDLLYVSGYENYEKMYILPLFYRFTY